MPGYEKKFSRSGAETGSGQVRSEKEISFQEVREKLSNPHFLPSHEYILTAFAGREDEFDTFCNDRRRPIFEFLNEDYINALADYFIERMKKYGADKEKPLVILEVGAGNGRLSHFLRQKLDQKVPQHAEVIATDSGAWNIIPDFSVEYIPHDEALKKYSPDIVIFSWMPYGEDYTADFRQCASVREYILIGETDGGCCGDEWKTWGMDGDEVREGRVIKRIPPYEADGFVRVDLDDMSNLQICRTDWPGAYYHSQTVSFRRGT